MIDTGKVLQNRYRIDKQIGQGGMGAVYVATDERFGSTVAIKETLCMDDNYRKAIEREARLLNSLKHAALPKVSDHFEEDNGQYLVMEYIPGEDLSTMMEHAGAAFPVEQVVEWAEQLLDALDFLHNQEMPVIHRDIKPQNLKITTAGKIILLDFGLAKGNPTDNAHQTAAKSIFGYTRNYASLEQIQGTGTDPRSDLYSLAATLYHLLTGVPPEDALTRAMAVLSQHDDPLRPANVVNKDIPKGIAGVLHRALDLNANQRPASAKEMRAMIRESESYAHFADAVTIGASRVELGPSGQITKILPGLTHAEGGKLTDVKTQLLPSNEGGQRTAVRSGDSGKVFGLYSTDSEAAKPKRRVWGAYAALGGIILAGCVTAAVFIYDPLIFATESTPDALESLPVAAVASDPPAPAALEASPEIAPPPVEAVADANAAAVADARTSRAKNPDARARANDAARSQRAAGVQTPDSPVPPGIRVEGETVYWGNVKITENGIEGPNYYLDENGIKRKLPMQMPRVVIPKPRNFTAEELRQMTPEQKRRLTMIWGNKVLQTAPLPPKTNPTATPN